VTGGAGYIGAHVVRLLLARHDVVVFDDLSTGRLDRLPSNVPVIKGSMTSQDDLATLFERHHADGVIHLAANKTVGESVRDAGPYWQENVEGVKHLLAAMRRAGVGRLLFASSAAVYGDTGTRRAGERRLLQPVNPYGITKREGERLISQTSRAHLHSLVFRQFNVVGAGSHPYAVDAATTSLLPSIFQALTGGRELVVRGRDYPTPDGSAVRDFIDVADVAAAYVRGVDYVSRRSFPPIGHRVVNLGSGRRTSVLGLVHIVRKVTGSDVPYRDGPPREGDAAEVVAAAGRARRMRLAPRRSLEDAVASAWESWQRYVAVEQSGSRASSTAGRPAAP
jgi:UDP-glucose 4-epimerase